MAEAISWEIREAAYDAFVTDGKTYEDVSKLSGVSISQLKRWGAEDGWLDARKEYRTALQSIRRDTVKLRAELLKNALNSKEPQDVYAFAALEKAVAATNTAASKKTAGISSTPIQSPEKLKNIKTPADAVAALREVVELKLNRLLSQPATLKLSQVRELKQTMELIDQMAAKTGEKTSDKNKIGFNAEQAAKIRELLEG